MQLLRTSIIPRKSPRKHKIGVDELILFQADKIVDIDSISKHNSPDSPNLSRLDNSVQIFNLKCNEETGILAVHKCIISVDRNLHVSLSYDLVIPLPRALARKEKNSVFHRNWEIKHR